MSCRPDCVTCYTGFHSYCPSCHPPHAGEGRPRRHRPGCAHCRRVRAMAEEYRLARHAAELAREQECVGYAAEEQLYGPLITFRDWLVSTRGERIES